MVQTELTSVDEVQQALFEHAYVADRALATAVFLTLRLRKPLLVEGEAGVGKTQVAKTLAEWLRRPLIRLQCYEGLDVSSSIYEWWLLPPTARARSTMRSSVVASTIG